MTINPYASVKNPAIGSSEAAVLAAWATPYSSSPASLFPALPAPVLTIDRSIETSTMIVNDLARSCLTSEEPVLSTERKRLEAQLSELNGEASNGTIDAAWKKFKEKQSLIPGANVETITRRSASSRLTELQAKLAQVEKDLSVKSDLLNCLTHPDESIPAAVQHDLNQILLSYQSELVELRGTGSDGKIHLAWLAFKSSEEKNPHSPETAEAHSEYLRLDQRRIELELMTPLLQTLLNTKCARDLDTSQLRLGTERSLEHLRSERLRLTGPSGFDGEIDQAYKVFDAVQHYEIYKSLNDSRVQIETRLSSLRPAAAGGAGASSTPIAIQITDIRPDASVQKSLLEEKVKYMQEIYDNISSAAPLKEKTVEFLEANKRKLNAQVAELVGSDSNGTLHQAYNEYQRRIDNRCPAHEIEEAKKLHEELHAQYASDTLMLRMIDCLLSADKRADIEKDLSLKEIFATYVDVIKGKVTKYSTQLAAIKASEAATSRRFLDLFGLSSPAAAEATSSELTRVITAYDRAWNVGLNDFSDMEFDTAAFKARAKEYVERFPLSYDPAKDFGYIEKKIVPSSTKIYVRADLHGDLKSLLENLKTLRSQGLLDENFNCRPGVHLMFLGDYMDRGAYSTQILDLLMRLRMQNPQAVTLIRGNHESISSTMFSNGADKVFKRISEQADYTEYCTLFEGVYRTFPLASFIGEKTLDGSVQYTMFTHGLFELYADPNPMLVDGKTSSTMPIQGQISNTCNIPLFSERVKSLAAADPARLAADLAAIEDQIKSAPASEALAELKFRKQSIKQQLASLRIHELASTERRPYYSLLLGADYSFKKLNVEITTFNWGDIGFYSSTADPGSRKWTLNADDIKNYLRLISSAAGTRTADGSKVPAVKVKLIFRGHQHLMQHASTSKDKLVATTLPVGMDSPYRHHAAFSMQKDRAYILTTSEEVKGWKKQALIRAPGSSSTEITAEDLIRSTAF